MEELLIQNIHQNLHAWDEESLQGRPIDLSQSRNHMQIDTNNFFFKKTRLWDENKEMDNSFQFWNLNICC